MGAISSLGKTSWMLNMADNIAASGRDVLYFSLEMSKYELIAKSISRLSFRIAGENQHNVDEAFTTFGVLHSKGQGQAASSILQEAMQRYRDTIGGHIWIHEGVGSFGIQQITETVENHIKITGNVPVVFIDYLQIIAPEDVRATDKQNTDKAVVELKRLASSKDVPVFAISSLNRLNYNEPINMAAFKESGAIEYGSDVLIGLQLYGIGYEPGEKQQAHVARVREIINRAEVDPQIEIEVKILKNRNGSRGGSEKLIFDKKFNSFHEIPEGFTTVHDETPFDDPEEDDGLLRI
jgi:replicative DNA helicase